MFDLDKNYCFMTVPYSNKELIFFYVALREKFSVKTHGEAKEKSLLNIILAIFLPTFLNTSSCVISLNYERAATGCILT